MVWWPQAARVYESRSREKFSHLPGRHSGGGIALESVISAFSAFTPPPLKQQWPQVHVQT